MMLKDPFVFSFLFLLLTICHSAETFQEISSGAIGGGNYSYYWLAQPGMVMLYLRTIEGDADLYVSSKNLKPTYDIENHELQSTTCGIEQIRVPSVFDRPIAIAVYGHPSHDISLYELKISIYDSSADVEDAYPDLNSYDSKKPQFPKTPSTTNLPVKDDTDYEERSVFWTLFLHILQVLLDLLVD